MKKSGRGFVRKIREYLAGNKKQCAPEKMEENQGAEKREETEEGKKNTGREDRIWAREMEGKFRELTWQCMMGDIESMMELSGWFRIQFAPELEAVVAAYEAKPDEESQEALRKYLWNSPDNAFYGKAYMMWIVRAALYGHVKAGEMIEKYSWYKTGAYLPHGMFLTNRRCSERYWASDSLRRLGLLEIPKGKTDCGLVSLNRKGYFDFYYVSWYCPADEDGYGREEEYEDLYYDEFFNQIRTDKVAEIGEELIKLEKRRERYWDIPEHNAGTRKYKKRLVN